MRIYLPLKLETGEELTLVRSKKTNKIFWWSITKGMFYVCNTPFLKYLKQTAESEEE